MFLSQVTTFRTYDTMAAGARRHAEGSLVYVLDQTDLYLRVRDGVRQVYVTNSASALASAAFLMFTAVVFPAGVVRGAPRGRECLASYASWRPQTHRRL